MVRIVVMDSGLVASLSPGMTAMPRSGRDDAAEFASRLAP
jgi:hypothetical protein